MIRIPHKPLAPLAALALALLAVAGCSNLIYLTGHKELPLPDSGEQQRTPIYHQGDWTIARGSIHNHTTFSDGVRSPEDLVKLARIEGMAVLGVADHREGAIKFKHGFKLPVNGIERVGYEAYWNRLKPLHDETKDIIMLIGAEVNPYLYNYGKVPHLVIAFQNRHLQVYGFQGPEDFQNMPVWRVTPPLKPQPYQGVDKFQTWVDYVRERGGVTIINHPESQQDQWVGPVHFFDYPPINHIHDLHRTDAFSILPEGYHNLAGGAGGIWDTTLLEYLMGMRESAPWAVGDADYHGPDGGLWWSTTLFYLKEFTEADVLAALREGRCVALMGQSFQDSYVAEFSVSETGGQPADPIMFGQDLIVKRAPVVRFKLDHEVPGTRTRLIRNGKVVLEVAGSSLEFTDTEMFEKKFPAYYRVEVVGPILPGDAHDIRRSPERESELFTNPIFVRL